MNQMEKETKVLLFCLQSGTTRIKNSTIEQLFPFDWDKVIQKSMKLGVAPLLYQRLKSINLKHIIPFRIEQKLYEIYMKNMARNMYLYYYLARILSKFQDFNIPVIILKGAYLAEVVYGNIALRSMQDVDLLVRENDFLRANEKLLQVGCIPHENNPRLAQRNAKDRKYYMSPIKEHSLILDIHWHIKDSKHPFNIDIDNLWERAKPAIITDMDVLALSLEDMLIHLCVHASFMHLFDFRLVSIYDIIEIISINQDKIAWDHFVFRTQKWGVTKGVFITLFIAKELFGADIPNEVLNVLKPNQFKPEVISWAELQIFVDRSPFSSLHTHFFIFWEFKNFRDKANFLLKKIFPSRGFMASKYNVCKNSLWIYLYYPLHLKNLFFRHIRIILKLVFRDEEILALKKFEHNRFAMKNWLGTKDA